MRRYHKKQCLELLASIEEANARIIELIKEKRIEEAAGLLEDCQQGAIRIGTTVESSEGEGTEAVHALEDYCELAYQIHEDLLAGRSVNEIQTAKKFRRLTDKAKNEIRHVIPTKYEAVFLPYKASMWDSLESIWRAADEDPDCDAYVIPIPYFDKNPDGSLGQAHYEADLYPDDVPVINYRSYDFEGRHPDMVYIHNPYDHHNHVTTVHPDYYSFQLKKYTDCLIYVPYYATAGNMAEGQALMLSYFYVDYIIVQSESMIGFFDRQVPKDKLLPLGSPKFDKVIRDCANPSAPPAEWAERIKGKRVFFYNTSLAGFLGDTERFLKKMEYVFDTFRGRDDACLIWRPHPLLESTIDSLRPDVKPVYEDLKQRFLDSNAGILDETPDIETTIALSDAYIGDSGTSVTSLFGVAGKPMYILNNRLLKAPEKDDWQAWVCQPLRGDKNNRYCITMGNRLFEDREGNHHYRYLCNLSEEYAGGGYYARALETAGKIAVFPANAQHILILNPDGHCERKIELKQEVDRDGAFAGFFNYLLEEPEVFYLLPNRYPAMVQFNARTEEISYVRDEAFTDDFGVAIDGQGRRIIAARWMFGTKRFLYGDGEPEIIDSPENEVRIPGMRMMGKRILCLNKEGTRLRAISLETGETEERELSWNGLYTGVLRDIKNMDVLWFLPYEGTVLGKWTLSEDRWETVEVKIDGLCSIRRPEKSESNIFYFSNGIFVNGKMLLAPNWGNKFVELDTMTHETREWIPPFPCTTEDKNDYWYNGSIGYFYQDPWSLEPFFFYVPEHKTYKLDLAEGTCREVPVTFDREEIAGMAQGFHKDSQWMPYCCYEDVFNSLEDIASGVIHGSAFDREKQILAYRAVNASPEGDCGKKVHREMVKLLFTP